MPGVVATGTAEADFRAVVPRPRPGATLGGSSCTADQPDFPTATKFVNAHARRLGVKVERASSPTSRSPAGSYPPGSFVVKSAQAFRAHVLDMFEPQDHPNDFAYPGGPADPAV